MIIDPNGYTVFEWTDRVGGILSQFGPVAKLLREEDWMDWANLACILPGIVGQQPPRPTPGEDWLQWAIRFNQVVRY